MKINNKLKKISNLIITTLSSSMIMMNIATASNAFEADDFYQQQDYEQARIAYLAAAEVGSPHVYYQLGTMYYKGQGTKTNTLNALLWFSLASEYQFNDSEQIVAQLMNNVDEKHRADVELLINNFKYKYGKQQVANKYLPVLITANLNKKVTFGGEGVHDTRNDETDRLFGITSTNKLSDAEFDDFNDLDDLSPFDVFNTWDTEDTFGDEDENELGDGGALIQDAPTKKSPLDLPFLATIDYDVAPDGSIRNIDKVYGEGRAGNIKTAIYNYSLLTLAKPTFDGKRVNFINRGHIGIHRYDLMQIRGKHKNIYDWVRRYIKKLEKDDTPQNNYKRAMLMLYYPWFPQEEGQAASLLEKLAEKGHVKSQYEYGLYLYREQIDIEQAIKWLSLASQYGDSNAQYHLAKILNESPWVVNDEKKSLFWYEESAKMGHLTALLKSAELKLLASDESLRDQSEAIDTLKNIESSLNSNPEYHYLTAISHLKGEYRDFPKVIKHLRIAISRGHTLNWDVSKWEDQLAQWTTGIVTIND
jgi:TPR repeat protein